VCVCVCVCACVYVFVFMAVTRSPVDRVRGPTERATTPSTSGETSSATPLRKPEFDTTNQQHTVKNKKNASTQRTEPMKRLQVPCGGGAGRRR